MVVKQKKAIFVTSDNREFDNEEEANAHDKIAIAIAKFKRSQSELDEALAEQYKTKDGHAFKLHRIDSYWVVRWAYNHEPYIEEVRVNCYNAPILDTRGPKVYVQSQGEKDSRLKSWETLIFTYDIEEMFWDEKNAKSEWANRFRQYIDERTKYFEAVSKF